MRKYTMGTLQTTRGCPFDCDFCSVSRTAGRAYRFRPLEQVQADPRVIEAYLGRGTLRRAHAEASR